MASAPLRGRYKPASLVALALAVTFAVTFAVAFLVTAVLTYVLTYVLTCVLTSVLTVSFVIFFVPFIIVVTPDLNEVNRPTAGVVLGAMLGPFFCLAGRHVQIQRLLLHHHRRGVNDERLCKDQGWRWRRTDINTAIHPRRQGSFNRGIHV